MRTLTIGMCLAVFLGGCARSHTLRLGRESGVYEVASLPAGIAEAVVLKVLGPPHRVAILEDGSRVLTYFHFEVTTMRGDSTLQIDPVFTRIGSVTLVDGGLVKGIRYFSNNYTRLDTNQHQRYLEFLGAVERVKASGEPARNAEGEILVDIDADRFPITGVLEILGEYTGLEIRLEPADVEGEVTLTSVRETWRNVLDTAAEQTECTVRQVSSRLYTVQKARSVPADGKGESDNPGGD